MLLNVRKSAKKQIAKGSYSGEVKDLLEKHAKADAAAHADALTVTDKTTLKDKDMRKALKENVQKGDDFLKDAIDNNYKDLRRLGICILEIYG